MGHCSLMASHRQEPELRCPICGQVSRARKWTLLGSVASYVRIVDGEFELPDGQQFSLPYYHVETGEYLEKLQDLELGG